MSEHIVIYEESVFTSSGLGGLGFKKSNKKQEIINFTPSPHKDFIYNETHNSFFQEMDFVETSDNTPLESCLFSRSLNEKKLLKKNPTNNDSDLILNFYNENPCNHNENNLIDVNKKRKIKMDSLDLSEGIAIIIFYNYINN